MSVTTDLIDKLGASSRSLIHTLENYNADLMTESLRVAVEEMKAVLAEAEEAGYLNPTEEP